MPSPILVYILTDHARLQMSRRAITEEEVRSVLHQPEQRYEIRAGRDVVQSRVRVGANQYLIRVFVDTIPDPPEVVSVYRTSRVAKYWRSHS
jgi:hypothetical protein